VQNVVSVFDNNLVRQEDYACTIECDQPITWFAYRHETAGSDVLVFWNGTTFPLDTNDTLPATIRVDGGQFTDPVWADLITGRIHEIPVECKSLAEGRMVLKTVPTYDAPAIIADRKLVLRSVPVSRDAGAR
jgi:hypothetical protein